MGHAQAQAEVPSCPVCFETLGKYGGPCTLPCGHNGCLQCFTSIQSRNPLCPLCRTAFEPTLPLSVNHELQDLISLATMMFLDENSKAEGWEAFPSHATTAAAYSQDLLTQGKGKGVQGGGKRTGTSYDGTPPNKMAGHLDSCPSAPQLYPDGASGSSSAGLGSGDVMSLEPPAWLPDSSGTACLSCHLEFRPFTRLRHHCRLCGKIFCHACCHRQALLPPRYGQRTPQRVCELCFSALEPYQVQLAQNMAVASQPPVLDAPDAISLRSWLNTPWSSNMEEDIFKAANMLHAFTKATLMQPEMGIPTTVLQGAAGIALLSVLKVGAGWSLSYGTGVLVARAPDGGWSAPCAVSAAGVGWGLQVGGELTDLLLVLRSKEAVAALCGSMKLGLGLGGNASVALGPVGRHADASIMLTPTGAAAAYSYSCSKGAFIGISVESSALSVRAQVNHNFYGMPVTPKQLLLEHAVPRPPAASLLYEALQALMHKFENRGLLVHTTAAAAAAAVAASSSSSSSAAASAVMSAVESVGSGLSLLSRRMTPSGPATVPMTSLGSAAPREAVSQGEPVARGAADRPLPANVAGASAGAGVGNSGGAGSAADGFGLDFGDEDIDNMCRAAYGEGYAYGLGGHVSGGAQAQQQQQQAPQLLL